MEDGVKKGCITDNWRWEDGVKEGCITDKRDGGWSKERAIVSLTTEMEDGVKKGLLVSLTTGDGGWSKAKVVSLTTEMEDGVTEGCITDNRDGGWSESEHFHQCGPILSVASVPFGVELDSNFEDCEAVWA
ncbi:hypothetical protein RRG08_062536 [Elysia crispata]|uniref:Uncharacterized protein n=1 Tax=Elysia crispata TaxID=231223 RepID=A0AAE1DRJ2_9GAST|nr:hypothetical protein RRG08_062536 [Elysia crispata]